MRTALRSRPSILPTGSRFLIQRRPLESGAALKLKSGTLQLQDALTDTVGPLLSIGNASAGASKNLATDTAGRIVATDLPAGNFIGLTDTPSSYGTAGQSVIVNPAADGLIFGAASGGAGTPAIVGP